MSASPTVWSRPTRPWVFRHLGKGYVESILRPAARLGDPRSGLQVHLSRRLLGQARGNGGPHEAAHHRADPERPRRNTDSRDRESLVQEIFLRKIQLPPNLKEAIEQKMRSEQEAARMTFVLQREEREAERKRIEAKGIRDFQAIVTEGISDKLLQWKGIEATEQLARSSNAKLVVVGSEKGGLAVDPESRRLARPGRAPGERAS